MGFPATRGHSTLLTGKEVWRFHVVPQPGDENFGTWGVNGWQDRRGPGVWIPMTVDPVNDLVLIALGNATGSELRQQPSRREPLCDESARAAGVTGKRKWHFQMTHHDIYDWDLASPPALVEAVKDGQRVPAVAR
jgi:quinoprotein glucose dehydrogenase